jgi:hypothetical protein
MLRPHESLRRGLVGAWCPSLGATGYTLTDRSGNGRHCTLTNMGGQSVWVASGSGVAISFDGSNDVAATSSGIGFPTGSAARTLSIWVNVQGGVDAVSGVLQLVVSSGQTFALHNYTQASGLPIAFSDGVNGGNNLSWPASATPALNRWDHVAITLNANAYALYRNGRSVLSGTFAVTINTGAVTAVRVGSRSGVGVMNGYADDARVYSRALTPAEILLLASRRGIGLVPQRQRRTSASSKRLYLQVSGTWKETVPFVNVGGTWKEAAVYRHDGTSFKN